MHAAVIGRLRGKRPTMMPQMMSEVPEWCRMVPMPSRKRWSAALLQPGWLSFNAMKAAIIAPVDSGKPHFHRPKTRKGRPKTECEKKATVSIIEKRS